MPDYRKPLPANSSRPDSAALPDDSFAFSIETTTMRLKSLRLRRAEAVTQDAREAAKPAVPDSLDQPAGRPSGRVRHDERGMAVWDWAVATGEFAALSATRAMKKLEISELSIEDAKPPELKLERSGRDKAGGFDPYNQLGSGKRLGEAAQRAGVTGSADRERAGVLDQLLGKKKPRRDRSGRVRPLDEIQLLLLISPVFRRVAQPDHAALFRQCPQYAFACRQRFRCYGIERI
jgi:hypothetical protein